MWLTSRFLTFNWNPVVFPVFRFDHNKIDSRIRLVDASLALNFKENVKVGTDILLGKPDKLLGSDL